MAILFLLFNRTRQLARDVDGKAPLPIRIMCHASTPALLGFAISGTFLTQSFTWPLYLQMVIILALYRYLKQSASANE